MEFKLFLIALLSHVIFDFVFQDKWILINRFPKHASNKKNSIIKGTIIKTLKGNGVHALTHFIGIYMIIFFINMLEGQAIHFSISQLIVISILHFIIDEGKSLVYLYKERYKDNLWIFLLDQLFHLLAILLVTFKFNTIVIINTLKYKFSNYPKELYFIEKLLIVLIVFFITTWAVGIFIRLLVRHITSDENLLYISDYNKNMIVDRSGKALFATPLEAKNGGFIIGVLERIFIISSIIMNYPAMIGFVLTTKSVARLKKLSNDNFAEYFIIGTFLSFIAAILGGVIIRSLFI